MMFRVDSMVVIGKHAVLEMDLVDDSRLAKLLETWGMTNLPNGHGVLSQVSLLLDI